MIRPHPWQVQAEATDTSGEKVLAAALRSAAAAGAVHVQLLDDGFAVTTADGSPLHTSTRTFLHHSPQALARYLGLPEHAVQDARRGSEHPHDDRPR